MEKAENLISALVDHVDAQVVLALSCFLSRSLLQAARSVRWVVSFQFAVCLDCDPYFFVIRFGRRGLSLLGVNDHIMKNPRGTLVRERRTKPVLLNDRLSLRGLPHFLVRSYTTLSKLFNISSNTVVNFTTTPCVKQYVVWTAKSTATTGPRNVQFVTRSQDREPLRFNFFAHSAGVSFSANAGCASQDLLNGLPKEMTTNFQRLFGDCCLFSKSGCRHARTQSCERTVHGVTRRDEGGGKIA